MSPHAWLLAHNLSSAAMLGSGTLGIVIWIGVAILSLALMILMRTRWGQSEPLSKCVVLSVFAHLLLFLYAHGTRLLDSRPTLGDDDAIHVAFIASDASLQQEDAEESSERPSEPWEQLSASEPGDTQVVEAPRMEVPVNVAVRTAQAAVWSAGDDPLLQHEVLVPAPVRPSVAPPSPVASAPTVSPLRPTAIEAPVPVPQGLPEVAAPEPVRPERIDPATTKTPPADDSRAIALPKALTTTGSQIQQLADVEPRPETADALLSQSDQLSESENRGAPNVDIRDRPGDGGDRRPPAGGGSMVALPSRSGLPTLLAAAAPVVIEQAVARATPRLGDGQPLPEPYRLRALPAQNEVAESLGGSAQATAAVDAALAWLAAAQEDDGSWDPGRWGGGLELKVAGHDREGAGVDADSGITGLAILAFLGNGQTHLEGTYRKNVQRGLEYLLHIQGSDGNLSGPARLYAKMYCHGMASLALSEALAMTGDTRIRPYVEQAVAFTVRAQHPISGGWRYQPGDQGDMSQFGWQVMALKSASLAGIPIPQKTREGMLHFLQRCEHGLHGGKAGYKPGAPPSRAMTAEALVCRYFLDLAPDPTLVTEATDYLAGELPQAGVPNEYYWYYGTLAMFQVQGEAWTTWNAALQQQVLRRQRTDGPLAGSWDPDTLWGGYGGRVYTTAMAAMSLEVYYRYLPLTALRGQSERR
ncbi:MAG: prenyltransferase/squalene oxidase repeat-containing protein [Pirellulaceae bacterium]